MVLLEGVLLWLSCWHHSKVTVIVLKLDVIFSFFLFSLHLHPSPSVRQSVQEPVNHGRRWHQVLQLQVEDPLKALSPLGA